MAALVLLAPACSRPKKPVTKVDLRTPDATFSTLCDAIARLDYGMIKFATTPRGFARVCEMLDEKRHDIEYERGEATHEDAARWELEFFQYYDAPSLEVKNDTEVRLAFGKKMGAPVLTFKRVDTGWLLDGWDFHQE